MRWGGPCRHPRIFFAKDTSTALAWAKRRGLATEMPIQQDRSQEKEPESPTSSPFRRRHYRVTICFEGKMPHLVERRKKTNPPGSSTPCIAAPALGSRRKD